MKLSDPCDYDCDCYNFAYIGAYDNPFGFTLGFHFFFIKRLFSDKHLQDKKKKKGRKQNGKLS